MVMRSAPMRSITSRITSMGQGEPAMMPVRRSVRSKPAKSGWPSCAMNMVGTPWTAVQRSSDMARRVCNGSKCSAGITMVDPCTTQFSVPITQPKQW